MVGNSGSEGFLSSIGKYFEKSLIIDLGTIAALGLNFMVMREHFEFGDSLFEVSTEPTVIAAQLSGIMLIVYVAETIADKQSSGSSSHI